MAGDETPRPAAVAANPDAGDHMVTADATEIAASARAVARSRAAFPYYQWRYGERGARFGASDSGWLAALCSREPAFARGQIRWLGVVLSSRGMPQLLVESHLRVLHEELGRSAEHRLLIKAAAELRMKRRRLVADQTLDLLQREFSQLAPEPWRSRVPEMGRLIGAAVADERQGIERAVISIEEWALDAERFPADWLRAVRETIAAARGG